MSPPSAERVASDRKILAAAAIAVTAALAACNATSSPESNAPAPLAYEPPGPVTRAPLSPPEGYASATASSLPTGAGEAERLGWHASPRWAAIKGNGMLVGDGTSGTVPKIADPEARFKAAKAKADDVGVENLSDKDVEGLTQAQLRELRGY
jgi:hypothetical protein